MKTRKKIKKKRQKTNEKRKKRYDRKKMFYIGTYILGYALSLLKTGVPSLIYLVPIKLMAVYISAMAGTALYTASIGMSRAESLPIAMKKTFWCILLFLVVAQIERILLANGVNIDIKPFIGI